MADKKTFKDKNGNKLDAEYWDKTPSAKKLKWPVLKWNLNGSDRIKRKADRENQGL